MISFREPQLIMFTEDLPRMVGFYTSLGFTEVFRTPSTGDPIHVDLELDGYRLGFSTGDSSRDDHGLAPITSGQRVAVILWTDDVDSAFAELVEGGCPSLQPPHRWLDRLRIAWVSDPDGNPIQLVQSLE